MSTRDVAELAETYELLDSPDGSTTFDNLEDAMKAAEGNERRVWTLMDGDVEPGMKVWVFRYNDALPQVCVMADDFDDALSLAIAQVRQDRDEDVFFEDWEAFFTSNPDDPTDQSKWDKAYDTWAVAGVHMGGYGYAVSRVIWLDEYEEYTY